MCVVAAAIAAAAVIMRTLVDWGATVAVVMNSIASNVKPPEDVDKQVTLAAASSAVANSSATRVPADNRTSCWRATKLFAS